MTHQTCKSAPQFADLSPEEDDLIVGLDSEFVPGPEKNDVVSYQGYVLGKPFPYDWIEIMEPGERLTLGEVLGGVLRKGLEGDLLERCPTRILLAIHWSLVELTSLRDYKEIKNQFDGLRNTYVTFGKPFQFEFRGGDGESRTISVTLFDTTELAPDKHRKLQALGDLLGLKKLEVSDAEIANARGFLANDPDRFRDYGIRDAEIAARWLQRMGEFRQDLTNTPGYPKTLGQIAQEFTLSRWKSAGVSHHDVLGTEESVGRKGIRKTVPIEPHHKFLTLATEGFHGGRNETYYYGASPVGNWADWDINGAYVTALCALGTPDWNGIRVPRSVDEFTPDCYGVAHVRFRFPDNVRFPCLPVRTKTSLIFPLAGESYATAPELALARSLGATMEIIQDCAYLMPMLGDRPFLPLAREITRLRRHHGRSGNKSFEALCKTVGNSIYGKLCQGLQLKRVFDTREGETKILSPSKLTNAFLANMTTGMVRSFMGEILNRIPPERMVISATTDGFITDATDEEVRAAANGPIGLSFRDRRIEVTGGDATVLKLQHRARQVLAWRTRGQATIEGEEGFEIILAKAGISAPGIGKEDQNQFIVKTFATRKNGDVVVVEQFRTLRQLHEADGALDAGKYKREIAYRMDYDWKRIPGSRRGTSPVYGVEHLFFDTRPLPSTGVYQSLRDGWYDFTRGTNRLLKTERDLEDFEGYLAVVPGAGRKRSRKRNPAQKEVLKTFLRAYVREELGLKRELTNRRLLQRLAGAGFELKITDVENAARPGVRLKLHHIHATPAVTAILDRLRQLFPSFEADRLVAGTPDLFAGTPRAESTGQMLFDFTSP